MEYWNIYYLVYEPRTFHLGRFRISWLNLLILSLCFSLSSPLLLYLSYQSLSLSLKVRMRQYCLYWELCKRWLCWWYEKVLKRRRGPKSLIRWHRTFECMQLPSHVKATSTFMTLFILFYFYLFILWVW